MNNVSIRDVAAHAQVSMATVSNTLNNPGRVSKRMQAKVHSAIAELGYVPNESARALRSGRSREIGLVVHDIRNPFFSDVALGADNAAEEVGDVVTLCSSAGSPDRERLQLRRLAGQHVKGIIINPVDLDALNPGELLGAEVPIVVIARRPPGREHCSVWVDEVAGGELAAGHLLEQGHRSLAFLGNFPGRIRGVRLAMSSHQDPPSNLLEIPTDATLEGGQTGGGRLAALDPATRPTGIICGNDLIALGVLNALAAAGIRVPDDIAVVGYDDIAYAAAAATPLTTVRQPREEMGRSAVRLLLEEIADRTAHQHRSVVFPGTDHQAIRAPALRRRRPPRAGAGVRIHGLT